MTRVHYNIERYIEGRYLSPIKIEGEWWTYGDGVASLDEAKKRLESYNWRTNHVYRIVKVTVKEEVVNDEAYCSER